MGFERKMGQAALGFAILICPGAALAGEPLVVTTLGDPELMAVAQAVQGRAGDPALDATMQGFASAISQAAAADQESIAARCKAIAKVPAGGAGRAAWEANCRYLRR